VSDEEDYDAEVESLYVKWAGKTFRFLTSMGCEPGLAEEITDDAFLAARSRWARVRTLEKPEWWVRSVARNMRRKRQPALDARAKDLHPDPGAATPAERGDFAGAIARRDALLRALRLIPPRMREAVVLRHVEGLPVVDTAAIMKISEGAVKNLTFQGLRKLRGRLGETREQGGV
jgi:RNA polymerase sigma factor (sigma-70 family)